jgi:branched-chain amino acid transport system substrate-binding protein
VKDQWVKLAEHYGYKVVLVEPYASTASDLTVTVIKMRNARPDVIFLASLTPDAILLVNTMMNLKVTAKAIIATGGGHASHAFIKGTGRNCEYIFDVSEWEPDINRPGIADLNTTFNGRYKFDLTPEVVDAFASVYVIADALERAATDDPEGIRSALAGTSLCPGKGRLGINILAYNCIEFDKNGQNKNALYVVVQFRNIKGRMERVTVWPADTARKGYKPVFPMP